MDRPTATRTVTVRNAQGLHARPAGMFVRLANQFAADIRVSKDGGEPVDGKSILGILTLAAGQGSQLEIRTTGVDGQAALDALAGLVEEGFSECDEVNLSSDGTR